MNLPHAVVGMGGTGSVAGSMRPEKRSISRARTNCRATGLSQNSVPFDRQKVTEPRTLVRLKSFHRRMGTMKSGMPM